MIVWILFGFFFFKQKTAYEMRISDWSSDVCSSDLPRFLAGGRAQGLDRADLARTILRPRTISDRALYIAGRILQLCGAQLSGHRHRRRDRAAAPWNARAEEDRKSTRLNSSH